jgi:hypothetical protein
MATENSEEEKTFKEEARVYVIDWLEHTTSHGIPNILRARNLCVKIMWAVLLLASTGYAIYLCVDIIRLFSKHERTISQNLIHESPTKFPSVTFCNLNPFDENYLFRIIKKYNLLKQSGYDCAQSSKNFTQIYENCKDDFNNTASDEFYDLLLVDIKRAILNNIHKISEIDIENIGIDIDVNMLISCKFNGRECDSDWFTTSWNAKYGYCYTFNDNSSNILRTTRVGQDYGLSMSLQISKIF